MASDEGMKLLRECHAMLRQLLNGAGTGGGVADDRDLDSQWGDEEIKKDPPRWKGGESFAGKRMTECSPEFLDEFAAFKDWCAENDDQKAKSLDGEEKEKKIKYAGYGRKSAARARGWAQRLRAGWKPPTPAAGDIGPTDEGW